MRKCEECPDCREVKDDSKQYKNTRAVICGARHDKYKDCYEYRWLFVDRHLRATEPEPVTEETPIVAVDKRMTQDILKGLKKVGKR